MLSATSQSLRHSIIVRNAVRTASPAVSLWRRGYHENIVEHYENPRNVGALDKNDRSVGTVRNKWDELMFSAISFPRLLLSTSFVRGVRGSLHFLNPVIP